VVVWDGDFAGVRFGLVFGRAERMLWDFLAACRRGDVVKNRGRWKLLEERKRWTVRGGKAHWCRMRHPLEKADICHTFLLVINPTDHPTVLNVYLENCVKSVSPQLHIVKKSQAALGESANPLLAPSDSGGPQPPGQFPD
jgi:hypothetical protein